MTKAEEPGSAEREVEGRVVDSRLVRAARKRARRFPWSVGTAPKAAGESALGTEEEDRVLREARAAAWRRSLEAEALVVELDEGEAGEIGVVAEGVAGSDEESGEG